jgi:hypothetical protein
MKPPWWTVVVLVLFLPVALSGAIVPPNEYQETLGIGGGVDCDGPLAVILFAAPTLLAYMTGAVSFGHRFCRNQSWCSAIIAMLSCVVIVTLVPNIWQAYREFSGGDHIQICGAGL